MSDIILSSSDSKLAVPLPKEELTTRLATDADIPWIDELQKRYNKNLGFMPKLWLVDKIKAGQILVAEERVKGEGVRRKEESDDVHSLTPYALTLNTPAKPVGYIIAQDRYMKRDELGIVYQLVVSPTKQRGFIGAALLKAQFDRSQYGCRLYCCWCAQDLEANHFWEAMGFYPLAFRNGADGKGKTGADGKKKPRVQIYWQKKIRGKDDTVNWWFPAKTEAGAMGADRLALPIPPGVHWSEVEPIEIPTIGGDQLLEAPKEKKPRIVKPKVTIQREPLMGGLRFAPVQVNQADREETKTEKPKRVKKAKAKIDPVFISKSRELRDKYLEQVNEKGYRLESAGKYELTRENLRSGPHPNPLPCVHGRGDKTKLLEAA